MGSQGVPGQLDQVTEGGGETAALNRADGPELKCQVLAQDVLQQLGVCEESVGGLEHTLMVRTGHALVPMLAAKFRQA